VWKSLGESGGGGVGEGGSSDRTKGKKRVVGPTQDFRYEDRLAERPGIWAGGGHVGEIMWRRAGEVTRPAQNSSYEKRRGKNMEENQRKKL